MNPARLLRQIWLGLAAKSSADYWERRYAGGLNSGAGSYGHLAEFKAGVLNEFVATRAVTDVMEFGCGDGNQLTLARYPKYVGLDVSATAIDLCRQRFANDSSKSFLQYDPVRTVNLPGMLTADLTMSLDVIYHLLEDSVYEMYLQHLFTTARRFVIVYSSDTDARHPSRHVRHHPFTLDVAKAFPQFRLIQRLENPHRDDTFADFYFYERSQS
ncbi:SAM-dependent methyltransferase [Povalibacter uvarum]|uniref:SAM-dependent methyltransferase n=1 Tax=Povalibacter uvarum TaxID=732238 RepID=A0A841HQ78_9GAMM|nr:class I SAM-dependent methyltransferase [Povalibacter uvarum]MBB6094923.1 SAM-dependent methyltransferase [Povalibacter uvarum]